MKDGTMFKGLLQYEDQEFFLENRIIEFDTINETLRWKIFAVFETTTDFYYIDTEFPYDEMWLNFLDECRQMSIHQTHMNFYKDDIFADAVHLLDRGKRPLCGDGKADAVIIQLLSILTVRFSTAFPSKPVLSPHYPNL